jgi:hypothetical protein
VNRTSGASRINVAINAMMDVPLRRKHPTAKLRNNSISSYDVTVWPTKKLDN